MKKILHHMQVTDKYTYLSILNSLNVFISPLAGARCDTMTNSSRIQQVWIQSFPLLKLIAIPRLKSLVCRTIFREVEEEYLELCLSQDLNSGHCAHFPKCMNVKVL